jgi:hypothetical protein
MLALLLATPLCFPVPLQGGYLVVLGGGEKGHARAAEALAKAHAGEILRWQGDWQVLERELLTRKPRDLALVLPPESIDANLPRRLVPILARFDGDPFVDCAYGLITGADGEETERFVANILRAAKRELPKKSFSAVSAVLEECYRSGPEREAAPVARSLEANRLWLTGDDPDWREFLARERDLAEGVGLIEWGHCGDSQGIWLFSMYRNMDRAKHWPFDPARVGADPDEEMPRLGARDLAEGLELFPAVVINGACHAGVTRRTMVGPDIVSTFGDTGGVIRFFDIAPEDSFPLQAIRAGASAYIGCLAANNANRAALEEWWVRRGGVALGEVVRRTLDELVLADEDGELVLPLFEDGKPEPEGSPMFEDCAQRVLFGDPAFVPWKDVVPTSHAFEVRREGAGLVVRMRWEQLALDPWVWDPWRASFGGEEQGRLYERIELDEAPGGEPRVKVREAWALRGGEKRALALTPRALLERDRDGRAVLHLKASGRRADMDAVGVAGGPEALEAVFEVSFAQPTTGR